MCVALERSQYQRLVSEVGVHRNLGVLEFAAGFLVPIHCPGAIAWCLRRLALEPGLWERQRQAALELATTALSWEAYGERAIQHYQQLLERN